MHSLTHAIINATIALLLGLPAQGVLLVVAAGVLIDLDHLIYYYYSLKGFTLGKIYRRSVKHWLVPKPNFFLFHTLEFSVFVAALAVFNPSFQYISLGILLHLLADAYDYAIHHANLAWAKHFLVSYYIFRYLRLQARHAREIGRLHVKRAKVAAIARMRKAREFSKLQVTKAKHTAQRMKFQRALRSHVLHIRR
ncbi:hypothetical protein HY642_06200 [Candidatus Woesearchaeota archaeon]|nr:hypothetical protein [Candidatus Woesearchaeota archaeon]